MGLNSWNRGERDDLFLPQWEIENFIIPDLKIDYKASPIMFIGKDGKDYQTPEGLFAADREWREKTYLPIDTSLIKKILPKYDLIDTAAMMRADRMKMDALTKIPDNVVWPLKDFKLDENGNAVDWQEYYEVNGVRVPAEVYEAKRDAEIAKLMWITKEELRDRVASLLPQISSWKDVPPVILQEPDKRPQE